MTTSAAAAPLGQLDRYVTVGAANTAISFAVYALLIAVAIPTEAAAALAFAAGAVNGYVLNRRWTFAAADSARARTAYVCVQGAGALASGALVWALVHEAGASGPGAYVVAVPPITLATFLANRFWDDQALTEKEISSPSERPSSLRRCASQISSTWSAG